jgi:hypothetical protein
MALTKIDDVQLYAGFTSTAQQTWEMKNFLDTNHIQYQLMFYGEDERHTELFSALSSWWPSSNITGFPVLVYTEIHDDLPPSRYPRIYYTDLNTLQSSSFLTDYQLGRTPGP